MDPPAVEPGSVARARMQAEQRQQRQTQDPIPMYPDAAGTAESSPFPASRNLRQKGIAQHDGGPGRMISRPTPMPQFSAPETPSPTGSTASPASYRPPANRPPKAPQRPPRPSRIPSMVDQARLQEPTPLFIAPVRTAKSPQESIYSQLSPSSQYSFVQPSPSAGYLTDLPSINPMSPAIQQKKGVILGPPPSSRRGASSFYSNASFVSPIIEETPYSRSHGSYASSAAMPENWGSVAGNNRTTNVETFYDESVTDASPESIYGDFGDERRLVQPVELDSAAIPVAVSNQQQVATTNRTQALAVNDKSTSWNVLGTARRISGQPLGEAGDQPGREDIIQAYAAASSGTTADFRFASNPSGNNTRSSAMKRGLRIDMDAVREAESRGSLTSLPDLIRRATKLAAMIDKGKRPTSRMDNLSDLLGEKQSSSDGRGDTRGGRPASGLSDMLAAFPPPVSTPQFNNGPNRSSWLGQGGWPLRSGPKSGTEKAKKSVKSKRRCCGLPLWAVIVATILLLCVIVAAIVVPLELFVFNKSGSANDNTGIDKCRKDLTCLNGGTNVISSGTCSCICSGGFTGPNCATAASVGCTTTDIVSIDRTSTIKNVTLGQSIPRLIAEANSTFSVPLSGTSILAKINANGLSCIAQNSLVTFNGRSTQASSKTQAIPKTRRASRQAQANWAAQISNDFGTDTTLSNPRLGSPETATGTLHARTNEQEPFNVTDTVIDFCRVSVLFVLQEQDVNTAQDAQSDVQAFLTKITASDAVNGPKITQKQASNITIGNGSSINLVDFHIDLGNGLLGGIGAKAG
ncbi:hypothetical protein MY4038_009271 [Beauveria bassiana]